VPQRPPSSLSLDFTERPLEAPVTPAEPARALSVAELDRAIKGALEGSFASPVWVEGEVSGARPATSGHMYFAFKDEREDASIDVAIYKTNLTPRLRALIVDGARIRLRGKPTFWAPRGRLQLVADRAEPIGKGALLEALERLKEKLLAEGLFEATYKRPLPVEPRIIGVVTSKTGAVIHDICRVAFRRGSARILLAPALVQGAGAAASMCGALVDVARVPGVDVVIVGRGGGAADDLSAFNDEALVRAVRACPVPVISAVGHEVDVTLTDFAADARAATPSQAAEMVVPDARARRHALAQARARLMRAADARIDACHASLIAALRRLGDPRLLIASFQQSLDDRLARLTMSVTRPLGRRADRLIAMERRLARLHPSVRLRHEWRALAGLEGRMAMAARRLVEARAGRVRGLAASLDAMSPLRVLARGYAIATTAEGRAVRDAREVRVGATIDIRVARGSLAAEVRRVDSEDESAR
jgi:exodeoxyribonuclease VII large subunit